MSDGKRKVTTTHSQPGSGFSNPGKGFGCPGQGQGQGQRKRPSDSKPSSSSFGKKSKVVKGKKQSS